MIRIALPLVALSLVACAPMQAQTPPVAATACGGEKLGSLIGKPRNADTMAAAQRLSGAARIRWIAPGTMVTMDYSETRLNVHTDENGKILKAKCG